MGNVKCKIYNLVMSLSGCEKDIPEAVLYGCIMLNSNIDVKTMEFLCADFGLRSLSQIAMGYDRIKSTIRKQNICEENVKKGVPWLLPVLKEIYIPEDSYIARVSKYKEDVTLDRLFEDAIEAMSYEKLRLFTNISSMNRINRFRNDQILSHGLTDKFALELSSSESSSLSSSLEKLVEGIKKKKDKENPQRELENTSITADLAMQILASFGIESCDVIGDANEAEDIKSIKDTDNNESE
ncbi:MAG: hypothetical protein K6G43_09290 [Lachnospiraceae bacterium]|nr:hypothetical protein [Lachnospiraceae bacterium]